MPKTILTFFETLYMSNFET